jgi:hypothetical protein
MHFFFNNLGNSLLIRFKRLGDLEDLNQSIQVFEETARLAPDSHPDMPYWLNNLGNSLFCQFEQLGDLEDLNRSISVLEVAVKLTPDSHPNMPSLFNTLGNSLSCRFEQLGDLEDLNQSIQVFEDAVKLTPDRHPYMPSRLNNLGLSLSSRFERLGDLEDLTQSIHIFEDAVKLTQDSHPDMPSWFNNLGNSLLSRFKRLGDLEDLNQSIQVIEAAVKLTPDSHPNMPTWLNNFGNSLLTRFKLLGDLNDLNQSIQVKEDAVKLTPNSHPNRPSLFYNLGNSLLSRFEQHGDAHDIQSTISHYSTAASSATGPFHVRFVAAKQWISYAQSHATNQALDACSTAMQLIPQLTRLGSSIAERHHQIKDAGRVAREAAAVAISHNMYETAVEWLEQGRSVIWNQLLQLRSPIDDLHLVHPELASAFESASCQLEGSTVRTMANQLDATEKAPDYHNLAHKQDKLLASIRQLDGFESFLCPKPITQLLLAAKAGPIVMLNWSKKGIHALILCPDSSTVIHLSLSDTPPDYTSEQSSHRENPTEQSEFHSTQRVLDIEDECLDHIGPQSHLDHDRHQEDPTEPSTQRVLDILKHFDHIRKPRLDHPDCGEYSTILGWIWDIIAHPILDSLKINVRLFTK